LPLRFEHADGILVFSTQGDVEFDAGTSVLEAGLRSATRSEPETRWHLWFDVQHSSESRESDEMRDIATLISSHREHLSGRCAVIATDDLRYGMGRVFQAYMESLGLECEVCRDEEAAIRFLRRAPLTPSEHQSP